MNSARSMFISYRRKDALGHARALHRDLCRRFGEEQIFFDQGSIEAGEDFTERLSGGVRDCGVLLALIGPGWLDARDKAGGRRLEDPRDFVRQEIALALALQKRVLPILFDDTPVPPEEDLPMPLQGLQRQQGLTLRGMNYEYDSQLEELVRRLAAITGRAPQPSSERVQVGPLAEPEKLSYLCDRSEQEDGFREAIRKHLGTSRGRPLIIVVHGRENEAHGPFTERLDKLILPSALKDTTLAGLVRFLLLPRAPPPDGSNDVPRSLRSQIALELQENQPETDALILDYVRRQRLAGVVAVTTWYAKECGGNPGATLRSFVDYWRGFPDTGEKTLVVGLLLLKYDSGEPLSGPLRSLLRLLSGPPSHEVKEVKVRRALEDLRQALEREADIPFHVLPELESVKRPDLDRWAQKAASLIGDLPARRLQAIIPRDEARPMDDVLEQLRPLITERFAAAPRRGMA